MISFLNEVIYDGGTDCSKIVLPQDSKDYSKIFWFTDGMNTLSDDVISVSYMSECKLPIYGFVDGGKSNIKFVRHIALSTRGIYYL